MGDTFVNQIQRVGTDTGGLAPGRAAVLLDASQFTITDQPGTVASDSEGGTITDVTIVSLKGGAVPPSTGSGITTGAGSAAILAIPLANGHGGLVDVRIAGRSPVLPATTTIYSATPIGVRVESSSLTVTGSLATLANGHGLPCSVSPTWSAGVLTLTATGPTIAITGAASNGAGGTTLTCAGGGLTAALTGLFVDISGVVGAATGTNGTHIGATFISATTFDIGVAFTGYTSGGVVVLTGSPVIAWKARADLLVAP